MGVKLKFFKWSISLLIFSFYLKYGNPGSLSVAGVFLNEYKFKNNHTKSKKNKYKCVLKCNYIEMLNLTELSENVILTDMNCKKGV